MPQWTGCNEFRQSPSRHQGSASRVCIVCHGKSHTVHPECFVKPAPEPSLITIGPPDQRPGLLGTELFTFVCFTILDFFHLS